jgi:class 3 adenylate cyclase/tetratricopeptide (TPR) repeat protein
MRCASCGSELIAGKQFCHVCGARATVACPRCGAAVGAGFRFCPDCGSQMDAPPTDAPAPQPNTSLARLAAHLPEELAQKIRAGTDTMAGERKQVTVLFCDLAGSTAIAERLDPEEYHDLLEQYVELAFREISRCEGFVNQLAGDGMMALFGAPIAHEDAPERAVRAALAIHEALGRLNDRLRAERGIVLQARVGIHTGPVVVGTVGTDLKMDYTAIGDTTNLASRLESLARPGTILVSEATERLVRGRFEMRPVGPFEVKGKSEPVPAFEVAGLTAAALSEDAAPIDIAAARGLTPLVGRDAELAQIEACYRQLDAHLAQVVAVMGDPGSGKSRLLYEFKERLAGTPTAFFEARCSAWNQMVPYHPFVSMFRRYFDLAPDEPAERARDKIARAVRELDASLERSVPFLCRMLGVATEGTGGLPEEELKRETLEAVAHVVVGESQRAPVVMLIEDLHWMDEPSREMLEVAVGEMASARVMLLVSHRPDYRPSWRTQAAFTQLGLRRLADPHVREIISSLAGGPLPAALEQLILTKAEGSPFLAEEITRSLIEEGHLAPDGGAHRLTRPVEEIRIPGTVQEVIAARLDRLGSGAKRVVQIAAVLGRQFTREQLTHLLAGEGIDVAGELEELERRGIIHRKNLFSKDDYRFGESLTQEVAYEGLLLKQRRQLHERVAQLLEAGSGAGGAGHAALLAHHFQRSGAAAKTAAALLRAARDAEEVPAYRTAASLYRQAWDAAEAALDTDSDAALRRSATDAAIGLCRMLVIYSAPDPGDSERVVQRARTLAERAADTETTAHLLTFHGMLMLGGGRERFAAGLGLAEQGLAMVQQAGLTQSALAISRGLAWSYLLDGRFVVAQRTIDWVIGEMERLGQERSDVYLGARYLRDKILFHRDDLEGTLRSTARTYELAVAAPNRTVKGGSAGTLAQLHFLRGEYPEAKRWTAGCIEAAQVIGNVSMCRAAAAIAVSARIELDEPVPPGLVELLPHESAAEGDFAVTSHLVVEALLALGDLKGAERCARLAHSHAAGRLREMLSALALGDVLLRLGPPHWDEAERAYSQAIGVAETLGARSPLAIARLGAGELALRRGDRAASARHLHQALTLCRDLGLDRYRPRAEHLLADAAGDEGAPAHGVPG